jgi:hypothetical protein
MKNKLRTFTDFPKDMTCPICGTNENKECLLIPIIGTQDDGLAEAQCFHTGCLSLWYDKEKNIIYQVIK